MIRDIVANNIHPEDRAIFNTTTTAQCNATLYAIAKKQPAFGFIAQLERDRWRTIAAHVAKQIHGAVVNNFDTETLEPLVFTRKNGFHPTRMAWNNRPVGGKPVHVKQPPHAQFSAQRTSTPRERQRAAGAGPSPTDAYVPLPVPTTNKGPVKIGCNNTLTKPKLSGPSLPASSCDGICKPKPGAEWAWCKSCKKQFRI